MKDWISIAPLYSDKYLAHARTYSHKYIKREPDGKGGWRYWYPTDVISENGKVYNTYTFPTYKGRYVEADRREGVGSTNATSRNSDFVLGGGHIQYGGHTEHPFTVKSAQQLRNANKASEIYREGLPDDMPRGRKNNGVRDKINSRPANQSANSSKEYLEELESNSKKNNFNFDNVTTWDNANVHSWDNANVHSWDNANIHSWENSSNSSSKPSIAQQTISSITTAAKNTYNAGVNFLKKLFS